MKTHYETRPRATTAFTLIELLVVIAVIGILAALLLPVTGALKIKATRSKAKAELAQVVSAIESYHDKYGHYPPDAPSSPNWPRVNQLYFELMGTMYANLPPLSASLTFPPKLQGWGFRTLDGSAQVLTNDLTSLFRVGGFINCTRTANADDAPPAKQFIVQLKPTQFGEVDNGVRLLACSVRWPESSAPVPGSDPPGLNPWRYVSSNPTNNPGSYDLWVDIYVGGKINRISNWSDQPQIVGTPF